MTVTLQDPQSGWLVHVRRAELPQKCRRCGHQMLGEWAYTTENSEGWACLDHLGAALMGLQMSPEFKARAAAKQQLRDAAPGDQTTVSYSMLAALGLSRG